MRQRKIMLGLILIGLICFALGTLLQNHFTQPATAACVALPTGGAGRVTGAGAVYFDSGVGDIPSSYTCDRWGTASCHTGHCPTGYYGQCSAGNTKVLTDRGHGGGDVCSVSEWWFCISNT